MEPWAAHLLIGYQGRYDVVTVAGSMALCLPKNRLPKKVESPRHEALMRHGQEARSLVA